MSKTKRTGAEPNLRDVDRQAEYYQRNFKQKLLANKRTRQLIHILMKTQDMSDEFINVPAGTPLDRVVKTFEANTDIPLSLASQAFIHLVSTYLVKKGAVLRVKGSEIRPNLWTLCLAPSGSGKTFSFNRLEEVSRDVLGIEAEFSTVAGPRAYMEELQEHNNSLWVYDEFAQFIAQIETPTSPLSAVKECLLKSYDGKRIDRKVSNLSIVIENPCLSILALNTPESFLKKISEESLLDGFAQRFNYRFIERDPSRNITNRFFYDVEKIHRDCRVSFEEIKGVEVQPVYELSPLALKLMQDSFISIYQSGDDESSFLRRLIYTCYKLALFYHLNARKNSKTIDDEDMGWAVRMTRQYIVDLRKILRFYNFSTAEKLILRCEEVKAKVEAQGKKFTPRILVQYVKDFKTTKEAREYYEFLAN